LEEDKAGRCNTQSRSLGFFDVACENHIILILIGDYYVILA
jgi:hypothetical protein